MKNFNKNLFIKSTWKKIVVNNEHSDWEVKTSRQRLTKMSLLKIIKWLMNFIKTKSNSFWRYYLTKCQNYLINEREKISKDINRFNNRKDDQIIKAKL